MTPVRTMLLFVFCTLLALPAAALERKLPGDVSLSRFIEQTRVVRFGPDNTSSLFAWWIPMEYWRVSMVQGDVPPEDRDFILDRLADYTVVVVQFSRIKKDDHAFADREELRRLLRITHERDGKVRRLKPVESENRRVETVLEAMMPTLVSGEGEFSGMHVFVFDDTIDEPGGRRADPYRPGYLSIQVGHRTANRHEVRIDTPLDALYQPRLCPNGKPAHISWRFCPWSGAALDGSRVAARTATPPLRAR